MGLSCVQCGNKVGLFKKPIDGLYCSVSCRDEADAAELAAREERAVAAAEPSRPAVAHPPEPPVDARPAGSAPPPARPSTRPAPASGVAPAEAPSLPCPKCRQDWTVHPGAGALGLHQGACRWCGFASDFVAIHECPNCRGASLIVSGEDDARCARCKVRLSRWGATA